MANHWGVTSFVALALLACFAGREVEAQDNKRISNSPPKFGKRRITVAFDGGHGGDVGHGGIIGSGGDGGDGGTGSMVGSGGSGGHGGHGGIIGSGGHGGDGGDALRHYHHHHPYPCFGRYCYHRDGDRQQQNPTNSQTPLGHILPNIPPALSCDVPKNTRITCGLPDISTEHCKEINCCSDGRHCFYGKAVTVQCTKDGQFIVVVARDATLPNIDLESISLLSKAPGCTHVDSNSDFAIYNFGVTACGTVVSEEPGVIIYENRMFSSYEVETGRFGVITRDSQFDLIFQCRYIGTTVESVVVEALPLIDIVLPVAALGPIRVELRLGNGQCISKGCVEEEVAYASYYTDADYPVSKVLRDPVYVEVRLLEKTDPNLVLTLGRCWATTSPNPHTLPQWDILTDGCPSRNDKYLSSLVPVGSSSGLLFPSHYRRFLFKMFTFVDQMSSKSTKSQPLREQVYIHCSTAVCTPVMGYSCEPMCYRKKRDVMDVAQTSSQPKVMVSVGPVDMGASWQ
ncbi:zona pellucida sperm-binding protein 4-like [Pseudoliparis swirei]|uniref:zona pellucida sperm-binding protein 4-like n=1 Tax=Pseudoliparis swirei TaxID=2059687 RepID=UPI0024BE55E1|nr:zona pellucida sperm-binding protein 4-like [Pseudoliparis swirei]